MSRDSDNYAFAEQAARGLGRHIRLAQMDAIRSERKSDIHAIINNQPYAIRPRDLQRGLGLAIEIPRGRVLVAKLDQRRAAGDEATDLFRMRQT